MAVAVGLPGFTAAAGSIGMDFAMAGSTAIVFAIAGFSSVDRLPIPGGAIIRATAIMIMAKHIRRRSGITAPIL
jgi:hypothetical protein